MKVADREDYADVGTIESMPGANENASEDTTTAVLHAQQWRDRLGLTVVLIHHTNASGTHERGHSSMRGAADFMIEMRPEDDVVRIECSKLRNGLLPLPLLPMALPLTRGFFLRKIPLLPSTATTACHGALALES